MSKEITIPIENLDLTIGQDVVEKSNRLLGNGQTPEGARRWIQGKPKETWESALIGGLLGTVATSPLVLAALAGVYYTDGRPLMHSLEVGFLGSGNRIAHQSRYIKIRTLVKEAAASDEQAPFNTTVFKGTRKHQLPARDERAHSKLGSILRKTGVDEFCQFWSIFAGSMAAVSPRPYTLSELDGWKILFERHDEHGNVFPDHFPLDYRETVSSFKRIKAGLFSLYTATYRKDLTPAERLFLDYEYLTKASLATDLRILAESVRVAFQGVGAR